MHFYVELGPQGVDIESRNDCECHVGKEGIEEPGNDLEKNGIVGAQKRPEHSLRIKEKDVACREREK